MSLITILVICADLPHRQELKIGPVQVCLLQKCPQLNYLNRFWGGEGSSSGETSSAQATYDKCLALQWFSGLTEPSSLTVNACFILFHCNIL